jgi:putative ABC transport system ATP-binding protein
MTALVALHGVGKIYRGRAEDVIGLADVSVGLEPGVITGLVGPSGSGKSTLVNVIVGWDKADEGEVEGVTELADGWEAIAVVPQDLGLLEELTLRENIALPVVLGNTAKIEVDDLIEAIGLVGVADQLPGAASLGEQQRAAIARALVTGPRLLVADEPTSHQDEANTFLIAELLVGAARDGSAVLIATHDRRVLEYVDVEIEMRDGRLVGQDENSPPAPERDH